MAVGTKRKNKLSTISANSSHRLGMVINRSTLAQHTANMKPIWPNATRANFAIKIIFLRISLSLSEQLAGL